MDRSQRLLLDALCPIIEAAVNDPDLKADLGIPLGIRFRVTAADAADTLPGSLPAVVTAVGEGFSANALYEAENKMRARFIESIPGLHTWPIYDH